MIYTLFFSRLRELDEVQRDQYETWSARLLALAEDEHEGFVDMKSFVAEDGERLTLVRFHDAATQAAWRRDPLHGEAQRLGRSAFYEEYRIVICDEVRSRSWSRDDVQGRKDEDEDEDE